MIEPDGLYFETGPIDFGVIIWVPSRWRCLFSRSARRTRKAAIAHARALFDTPLLPEDEG